MPRYGPSRRPHPRPGESRSLGLLVRLVQRLPPVPAVVLRADGERTGGALVGVEHDAAAGGEAVGEGDLGADHDGDRAHPEDVPSGDRRDRHRDLPGVRGPAHLAVHLPAIGVGAAQADRRALRQQVEPAALLVLEDQLGPEHHVAGQPGGRLAGRLHALGQRHIEAQPQGGERLARVGRQCAAGGGGGGAGSGGNELGADPGGAGRRGARGAGGGGVRAAGRRGRFAGRSGRAVAGRNRCRQRASAR